ncbi:MAG: hypothetical protein ABJN26_09670 [Stappiaceae bacterium]
MALLSIFSRNDIWKTGEFFKPWDPSHPSIFDHISALQSQDEDPNGPDLPDEARFNEGNAIRFVSGAMDNLIGATDEDAAEVVKSIRQVLKNPSETNTGKLYHLLKEDGAIGTVDDALSLISQNPPPAERFVLLFDWLARCSPDREPVKFAIAMLGILDGDNFKEMFLTLGAHEEFTKFAGVALANSLPENEAFQAQVQLAHAVKGWGRVDLVERLAPNGDDAFRHWLVRDGFQNAIMDEYLAYIAATEGRLLEQLSTENAGSDEALIDGAAGIFIALVAGGPAEDMSDYADGATAAFRWFDLIEDRPATLLCAFAAKSLRSYAEEPGGPEHWPATAAAKLRERATLYLKKPALGVLVPEQIRTDSGSEFWLAKELAPDVGIDPWPMILELQKSHSGEEYWYDLMRTDDPDRIDQVIALASDLLPLDEIAAGPADEMGLGPEWRHHSALDFIVQDLDRFPGKGWLLIAAALQSPLLRNRNMAAKALKVWSKTDWPPEALQLIRQAIRQEPTDELKATLESLLGPELSS